MSTGEIITTAHLREQIEKNTRAAFFFVNVGDEPLEQQVAGFFYNFAPGAEVTIGPRYDFQRGKKGILLRDEPKVILEGAESVTIAAKLLEFAGHKGLALCYGTPDDEAIKRNSRKAYIDWRLSIALTVQRKWTDTCTAAMRDPGALPPIQPAHVKREIAWLRKWQSGLVDRKAFVVRTDGADFDTYQEAADYLLSTYPTEVTSKGGVQSLIIDTAKAIQSATAAATSTEPMPAPLPMESIAPAPPQKAEPQPEQADVSFTLRMAKSMGVKLTEDEYIALVERDKPAMEKLLERLVAVRNMKNSGKPSKKAEAE